MISAKKAAESITSIISGDTPAATQQELSELPWGKIIMLLSKGPDSALPSDTFMVELGEHLDWNVVEAHRNDTEGYMKEFGDYFPVAEMAAPPTGAVRAWEEKYSKSK